MNEDYATDGYDLYKNSYLDQLNIEALEDEVANLKAEIARLSTYSHRNGETEPPEVAGYYWVTTLDGNYDPRTVIAWWSDTYGWGTTAGIPEWWSEEPTAIYGPIPEPKRGE